MTPMPLSPSPPKISKFRKARPSWALARPGIFPKPFPLAEPFPGVTAHTTPQTIFRRKVVKKIKVLTTTENNVAAADISSTVRSSTATNKYDIEPFYIHEAVQPLESTSQNSVSSYSMEPFYVHEAIDMNRTDLNKNKLKNETTVEKITASYIWHPLPIFEEKNITRAQDNITSEYMLQPRNMFDLRSTSEHRRFPKGHYITRNPKVTSDSVTFPLIINQVSGEPFSITISYISANIRDCFGKSEVAPPVPIEFILG